MRRVLSTLLVGMGFLALAAGSGAESPAPGESEGRFVIAIHGGGGVRPRDEMTPELEAAYRAALRQSLEAGYAVLAGGGDSIDAVEAAIRVMEDSPLFNAGKGSSFNREGIVQMDASIMDGRTLDAGAVGVVQRVRNPITLARRIMDSSPHVMMADQGALEFAKAQGLTIEAPHYFHTERKWESLQRRLHQGTEYGKRPSKTARTMLDSHAFGTVGAVALDTRGNLAAGTSTGGREGKLHGRIGDSPIIGAGTYANNATLAVSSTGLGEHVIRVVATKTMSDLMQYEGMSVDEATRAVIGQVAEMGGSISVVAVDQDGSVTMPYSGDGMYRGVVREDGVYEVRIYEE